MVTGDMVIAASTRKKNNEMIQKVMNRAKEANVKFRQNTLQDRGVSATWSHTTTSEGVKADETKLSDIASVPPSCNKVVLQWMLVMVKYLTQCILGEAKMMTSLSQLLRKTVSGRSS